jgi:hypothetical protein
VQRAVLQLEQGEAEKYLAQRDEKIRTQLSHMTHKHSLEREATLKKINTLHREQDKLRRAHQTKMLQKFLNIKSELEQQQRLENSKLNKSLQIKNYAGTIVGKNEGSMKSMVPPIM